MKKSNTDRMAAPFRRKDRESRRAAWESVASEMAAVLRQKTGAERLAITFGMWRFAFRLVGQSVRNQYPDWTEEQIEREVAKRMSHGAV